MHNCLSSIFLKFWSFVTIYVFISIKAISLYQGNLSAERIGNSGGQVSGMPCWNLWCLREEKCSSWKLFQKSWIKSWVPQMSLSYPQNKAICFVWWIKLSMRFFLEYCYTFVFAHNFWCPSKGCLVHDRYMIKVF